MIWGYPYFRKPPYMQSTCDAIPFDSTVPVKSYGHMPGPEMNFKAVGHAGV